MGRSSTVPLDAARALLAKARSDLDALEVNLDQPKFADEHFGFFCQQASEKSLKAVLTAAGVRIRKTHDLREILDILQDNGIRVSEEIRRVRELSPFAAEYRYDAWLAPAENLDRPALLALVRRCVEWAASEVERIGR